MGRVLVTGGGGFLGGAVVDRLLARGLEVRSFARGAYPALAARGVEVHQGDLADAAAVSAAVAGCEAVIHVAALPGVWGPASAFERANTLGTQHILDACRAHGVGRLVYTSTPSVVHAGGDIEGADESLPYPDHFATHYPRTKAAAERAVLAANGPDLATIALRPHLIWGPGDNHLVPRILARARAGRLRLVGGGKKLVDTTYIDNAADAHLDALDRLTPRSASAGRAYFISNGEPRPMADIINAMLAAGGLGPCTRTISPRAAWAVGAVLEGVFGLLRLEREPPMTRFVAEQLSTAHWYDISAARRDLGYAPAVSLDEGFRRLQAALAAPTGLLGAG
ncbi:MAG: NAD-dependent epimerase/dehydratase family protein [bacterium]